MAHGFRYNCRQAGFELYDGYSFLIKEDLLATTRFMDTPLRRMEHALRPWVFLVILPVFALINAGVPFSPHFFESMVHAVGLGIIIGLIGQPGS
jgi:Na+/H+ antiporter NhaA